MFTFISLLLRIRSRFTCRCRWFVEITNSFISYENFELTTLRRHLFFLFYLFHDISRFDHKGTDLILTDFFNPLA